MDTSDRQFRRMVEKVEMGETDCTFYKSDIDQFNGCPGLDSAGDDENCGECLYRLDNVIKGLLVLHEKD